MTLLDRRRHAPATARNREPILEVLRREVTPLATSRPIHVLEIASGSGQHAIYLAPALDVASWQPTDPDPAARESIDAWRAHAGDPRILPALDLDAARTPWPTLAQTPNVILCVNMIHIAPWSACEGLFRGAEELFVTAARSPPGPGAAPLLYLYGPYKRNGRHTAPSNEAFDEGLRSRDPSWGVRDLEEVVETARARGLALRDVVEMPANNLSVVFEPASSP